MVSSVIYPSEAEAFARVEKLVQNYGVWPGVIAQGSVFTLTFDPEYSRENAA